MKEKIDSKIKKPVSILNELGITTTGSCEGHVDYGAPAPWIKISPKKKPYDLEIKKLKKETSLLLKGFYKNRKVNSAVKLKIKNGKFGFWLYGGGKDFLDWRRIVEIRARKIENDQSVRELISDREKIQRKRKLPAYQEEMRFFEDFLKAFVRKSRPVV